VDRDGFEGLADSPGDTEEERQKHAIKLKMKIPDFMKRKKNSKSHETLSGNRQSFHEFKITRTILQGV